MKLLKLLALTWISVLVSVAHAQDRTATETAEVGVRSLLETVAENKESVSYTHLTLPTILRV